MPDTLKVLLVPHFRTLDEIFAPEDLKRLLHDYELIWAKDGPVPDDVVERALPEIDVYVGTRFNLPASRLNEATRLRAIMEVSGAFNRGIDYACCFQRGIRVLSCAPAFGKPVAELALALALAGCRRVVRSHEAMRRGEESWQEASGSVSLFGQPVGFIGFGGLARRLLPLLAPFGCHVRVYDPWVPDRLITAAGCSPASLEAVMAHSRVTFVLAVTTEENRGMLDRKYFDLMPDGALLVLISRAHLVNFADLLGAVKGGRIQAAVDVFPREPVAQDDPVRQLEGIILSPHMGAGAAEARREIGRLVVDDLELLARGLPPRRMQRAEPELVRLRLGSLVWESDGERRG